MHENISASAIRCHESEAPGGVEELHRAHLRFAERRTRATIAAATAAFGARAIGAVPAATAAITATFGSRTIGAIPATTAATFGALAIGPIAAAISAAFGARPIGAISAAATKSTLTGRARATRPAKSAATARGPKTAAAKAWGGGLGPEIGLTLAACAALFFSSVFGIVVEFVVEAHETLLTPGETIPHGQ